MTLKCEVNLFKSDKCEVKWRISGYFADNWTIGL